VVPPHIQVTSASYYSRPITDVHASNQAEERLRTALWCVLLLLETQFKKRFNILGMTGMTQIRIVKSFNLREKNKRHRRFLKNENQGGCLKVGSSVIPLEIKN